MVRLLKLKKLNLWSSNSASKNVPYHRETSTTMVITELLEIGKKKKGDNLSTRKWAHKLSRTHTMKSYTCVCVSHSVMSDSVTPYAIAHQAPLSMEFSRQEYRSVLPFPSPGALPDPGIEPRSSALQADSLPSEPPGKLAFCNIQYTVHCFCGPKKQCVISVLLLETRF